MYTSPLWSSALSVDSCTMQRLCDGAAQVHRQPGRQRGGVRHGAAAGGAARRLAGPGRGAGALWVPDASSLMLISLHGVEGGTLDATWAKSATMIS